MSETLDLFERNINLFHSVMPDIATQLENHQPGSERFRQDDGGWDIRYRDVTLYGEGVETFCEKQLKSFWNNPFRLGLTPPDTRTLDEFANGMLYRMMKQATEAGMEFSQIPQQQRSHHLIVFGVGLAGHLPELVEKTRCHTMILVEPNLEFLYHSMHVFDWSEILNDLVERKAVVKIIITNSPNYISGMIRSVIRRVNLAALDGVYIYTHYENTIFREAQRIFTKEGNLVLSGLGFFRDEMGMLTNTFENLKDGKSKIHNKFALNVKEAQERKNVPVFIIGSGPSLDKDIDFIKANKDKAIIFSCGTALRPLLTAGIKPDFQVELERGVPPYEILQNLSKEFDLSGITLVASTTIDPRIKELFDEAIFFFRSALCPYPIFGDRFSAVDIPGPTVANTGFSFAQEQGFRIFYNFGVDFGARDPEVHHSAASDYFGEMEAEEEKAYDSPVSANFGGKAVSGLILQWAKDAMESSIKKFSKNIYYNCSDGIMIDRMIPTLSETIELEEPPFREKVIQGLKSGAPLYDATRFRDFWEKSDLISELEAFSEDLIAIAEDEENEDYMQVTQKMIDYLIYDEEEGTPPSAMIYRGSLFQVLMAFVFYSNRLNTEEQLDDYCGFFTEALKVEMENMKNIATDTAKELGDTIPPSDDAEGTVISLD